VIGGLITATFLTLIILPILYSWLANWQEGKENGNGNPPLKPLVKNAILLVFCLFLGNTAMAQEKALTLKEALQIALQNHPSIQAANLQSTQSEVLQNLPYSLGTTDISYQGDGLFRKNPQRVNQIGVLQNIPHPAKIKAQNTLQNERVIQNILQKQLTKQELQWKVEQVYLDLQQRKTLRNLYAELIETYQPYYKIAKIRADLGETNRMEMLTIQSAINEFRLWQNQVVLEINNLERQLQNLLQTDDVVTSAETLQLMLYLPTDSLQSVQLQLAEQLISIEEANIAAIEVNRKPDFNFGYSAQNYFESGWLSGLQAGIQIPLFNKKETEQKVAAQRLQIAVVEVKYKAIEVAFQQQLLEAENLIQQYKIAVDYYRNQLDIINPEMQRIARLNYQAGEISYLELLNVLNLMAQNSKSYWEQILAHNQAVVWYRFLTADD
ncbi:MAG: TolC family protein, partial [Chitinophagales bacterium]